MGSSWMRRIVATGALVLAVAGARPGGAEGPGEYELKAAFLLNFARLTQWPESAFQAPDDPLVIGVWVEDPFGAALSRVLKGEKVHGRPLEARRIASLEDAPRAHLLFVPARQTERVAELRERLAGVPVLLVGESPGFAELGGAINLYSEKDRIRFEINRRVADAAGLKLSSRLLRLARLVEPEGDPGAP